MLSAASPVPREVLELLADEQLYALLGEAQSEVARRATARRTVLGEHHIAGQLELEQVA